MGDAAVELEVHERNEGARAFYDARGLPSSRAPRRAAGCCCWRAREV